MSSFSYTRGVVNASTAPGLVDQSLFEPEHLGISDNMNYVALILADMLFDQCFEDAAAVIEELLLRHNLLPFLVSAHPEFGSQLITWAQANFPSDAGTYNSSIIAKILRTVDDALLRLPPYATPSDLLKLHRCVALNNAALEAISRHQFSSSPVESSILEEESDMLFTRKRKSQKEHKRAQRTRRQMDSTAPSTDAFSRLDVPTPSSPEEATVLANTILEEQKDVIQEYLELLTTEDIKPLMRANYLGIAELTKSHSSPASRRKDAATNSSKLDNTDSPIFDKSSPIQSIIPQRAAHFFDTADELGDWQILVSGRAITHLRQHRRNAPIFDIIRKKIVELSHGFFSQSNQKHLVGSDSDVPIFEAKLSRDLRIVYQVDCASDVDADVDKQILKIYGIHTHAQFDRRLWDSIAAQSRKKGKEYTRRCIYRMTSNRAGNYVIPATFPRQKQEAEIEVQTNDKLTDTDFLEMHAMLALEKFIPLSQSVMNSILADEDATHVFAVSSVEQDIIAHPSSVFVLGRSGTGKTTTMLFRMLGMEKAAQSKVRLRQLFVTQSSVLAGRVQEYYTKLRQTLTTGLKSADEIAGMAEVKRQTQESQDLVDLDDEDDGRSNLPSRFSDLTDDHFPLFLTFDKLCKMLEADSSLQFSHATKSEEQRKAEHRYALSDLADAVIDLNDDKNDPQAVTVPDTSSVNLSRSSGRHPSRGVLTFETFLGDYWPHFNQTLRKGLDPALVWSEFMGVLKGSEMTINTAEGYLDRSTYTQLSHRAQSTFARSRDRIYSLFEAYLARKREIGGYDAADRTHALLRAINSGVKSSNKVHFLYVDEAQDNLIIDAQLLRLISANPHGFFWAGDTAQTISVGSSFRFNDLKAFLYRLEESDALVTSGARQAIHPESFQLAVNYRSHGGIIDAAASVIDLITHFFPDSIDVLAKERGLVRGPKPIFFDDWDSEAVRFEQFLFGEASTRIEFGAQQCILVRNDATRNTLREQIGDIGLIMTLYEAKGLEFSDVLLYNFFRDSPAGESEWRVVLNRIEKSKGDTFTAPRFDETRHAVICTELKFLYVGITRARNHCWMWDDSPKSNPMKRFWSSRNQIEICRPSDEMPTLGVTSSTEEWGKSGRILFTQKLYVQAIFCFDKAEMPLEKAISEAYLLRHQARVTARRAHISGGPDPRQEAFKEAGDAFIKCAELAARSQSLTCFARAGDCFVDAGNHSRAGDSYRKAQRYELAAVHYRTAADFDASVEVIKLHASEIDATIRESILNVARLFYLQKQQLTKAQALFADHNDMLDAMEDWGFDTARIAALEQLGRFAEAAELSIQEGRPLDAITFFNRAGDPHSIQRAAETALEGLWQQYSLGGSIAVENARQYINRGRQLGENLLSRAQKAELTMFEALIEEKGARLLSMGKAQYLLKSYPHIAVLCLDRALEHPPSIQIAEAFAIIESLEAYDMYGSLMRSIIRMTEWNDSKVQKLLGFRAAADSSGFSQEKPKEFKILKSSPLIGLASRPHIPVLRNEAGDPVVLGVHLGAEIRAMLAERLATRLRRIEDVVRAKTRFLTPCLDFTINNYCSRSTCNRHHLSQSLITARLFNDRVHIHLLAISLVHHLDSLPGNRRESWLKRIWLQKFFDALHPFISILGSFRHLSTTFPGYENALRMIRIWIQERLFKLDPNSPHWNQFMTGCLSTISLAFSFQCDPERYIKRAPCLRTRSELLRLGMDVSIVEDAISCLGGTGVTSINKGILFIRHIIKTKIPIDINVLTHFLERLAVYSILYTRHKTSPLPLHNLTLPLSWVTTSGTFTRPIVTDNPAMFTLLLTLGTIKELLSNLYSHADYLLFEGGTLQSFQIANVFIARICRALVLYGYNFGNFEWRDNILRSIKSLDVTGRNFPLSVDQFVRASSWAALTRALLRSWPRGHLDGLVRLQMEGQPPLGTVISLKTVQFSTVEDLLVSLSGDTSVAPSTKLSAAAAPFVPVIRTPEPTSKVLTDNEPSTADPAGETAAGELDEDDDDTEQADAALPTGDEKLQTDDVNVEVEPAPQHLRSDPTDEEIAASNTIQRYYRKHKARGTVLSTGSDQFFEEFLRQTRTNLQITNSRYIKQLLGPLPHILACLQVIYQKASKAKSKAKDRFRRGVEHLELEDVQQKMTESSAILKLVMTLQKDLGQQSAFHAEQSIDKLKPKVAEVPNLSKRCDELEGGGYSIIFLEDLQMGLRGIVEEHKSKPTAKRQKHPELNTEDLDE